MADTVTSSRELKLGYTFGDGDTRTTTLEDPKLNIGSDDVVAAATTLHDTQAFVGDKAEGAFVTISSAVVVETTRTKLDLS